MPGAACSRSWRSALGYALADRSRSGGPRPRTTRSCERSRTAPPKIDAYHWETRDKSWYQGHYYAVKGPGLALLTLPLYEALHAVDGEHASAWAARRARANAAGRWSAGGRPNGLYGHSLQRALLRPRPRSSRRRAWSGRSACSGAVLPAVLMLLLVRSLAERVEPGLGTAAAVTLGVGTLVLPFATLFFSHLLAALLGFAAFAAALARARGAGTARTGRGGRAARRAWRSRPSIRSRSLPGSSACTRSPAETSSGADSRYGCRRAGRPRAARRLQPVGVRVAHAQHPTRTRSRCRASRATRCSG